MKQTGSVSTYISTFNEYAAQVDWNESSLVARFRGGLKDEILESMTLLALDSWHHTDNVINLSCPSIIRRLAKLLDK